MIPGSETSEAENVVGAKVELELCSCLTRVWRTWMNSSTNKLDNCSSGTGTEVESKLAGVLI